MRQEVIIGVERRRSWPDELKLSILSEIGGGATLADVARRHDITRRQLRDRGPWPGGAGTTFLARAGSGAD